MRLRTIDQRQCSARFEEADPVDLVHDVDRPLTVRHMAQMEYPLKRLLLSPTLMSATSCSFGRSGLLINVRLGTSSSDAPIAKRSRSLRIGASQKGRSCQRLVGDRARARDGPLERQGGEDVWGRPGMSDYVVEATPPPPPGHPPGHACMQVRLVTPLMEAGVGWWARAVGLGLLVVVDRSQQEAAV